MKRRASQLKVRSKEIAKHGGVEMNLGDTSKPKVALQSTNSLNCSTLIYLSHWKESGSFLQCSESAQADSAILSESDL